MAQPAFQHISARLLTEHVRRATTALRDRHTTAREMADRLAAERAAMEPGPNEGAMGAVQGSSGAGSP